MRFHYYLQRSMDFSDIKRVKHSHSVNSYQQNETLIQFSKRRSQPYGQQNITKNLLVIYASGSMAANKELEIERGGLKKILSQNFYLCDLEHSKKSDPRLQYLLTPIQETGMRIKYKVVELDKIDASVNLKMPSIIQIAEIIQKYYHDCHAFIVITGLDTICYVGTVLSFMLENLSKLVICTGGYLPLSKMRNDSVSNLVQCFSVVAQASALNDVIIVCKNKGFRANRCIKMTDGDFENICSPNLSALCSIKTKLRVRSYLFEPQPSQQFRLFSNMSNRVKVLKLNKYECPESLAYDLKNPFIKGVVIQGYSFANVPNLPQLLTLFKEAFEDESRRIIFVNISEAICSKNESLMKQYLETYHIYYGGDMTCEAALAKLSYLIGKGESDENIIKLMQKSLRGELTQQKQSKQFKIKHISMMQIVSQVLNEFFPTSLKQVFLNKILNNVGKYIINKCNAEEFKQIFYDTRAEDIQNHEKIAEIADATFFLHRAVNSGNLEMAEFLIARGAGINIQDQFQRSPLFYAIKNRNKSMIQLLSKNKARVVATNDDLFQLFVSAIQSDDVDFFYLLYHIEFKETMKIIKNEQMRTVAHIAALLKANKCYKFMKQKFNVSTIEQDIYGFTANQYILGNCQ